MDEILVLMKANLVSEVEKGGRDIKGTGDIKGTVYLIINQLKTRYWERGNHASRGAPLSFLCALCQKAANRIPPRSPAPCAATATDIYWRTRTN